jgi:hypothetical protein
MRQAVFVVCAFLLACSSNVFHIRSTLGNYTYGGTAFFVNDTGLALTASHVLTGMTDEVREAAVKAKKPFFVGNIRAFLWWSGARRGVPARPLVVDLENDLALIQVAVKSSRRSPPHCKHVQVGDPVRSFGSPSFQLWRRLGVSLGVNPSTTPPKIHISNYTRRGYSGGLAVTRESGKLGVRNKCTLGVIVQSYLDDDYSGVVNLIVSSESITKVLGEKAPEFLRNFKDVDISK